MRTRTFIDVVKSAEREVRETFPSKMWDSVEAEFVAEWYFRGTNMPDNWFDDAMLCVTGFLTIAKVMEGRA